MKEKEKLVFFLQPLDANTNRCLAETLESFEKYFSSRKTKKGEIVVWECNYEKASVFMRSKKTLNLRFNVWLLSSNGKLLDRRGEFMFRNLKIEKENKLDQKIKKIIAKKKKSPK